MKIVEFLLSKDLICESNNTTSLNDNKLGRKGQMLRLNANSYSAIGISFEGKYLRIGLINLAYELLDHRILAFDCDFKDLDKLSKIMTDTIRELKSLHPETIILGTGIGLSYVVDPINKTINRLYQFGIYSPVPFDDLFCTFKDLPDLNVYIENDVNASCFGELMLRKKEKVSDLVYMALGTGLGSGIIIDSMLRHGSSFFAGDIGNLLISYTPDLTRQSLLDSKIEKHIGLNTINKLFNVDIQNDVDVSLEKKLQISEYICSYIVPLIYNLFYVLDITQFVIAGITVEFLGDMLFEHIDKGLNTLLACDEMRPVIKVMPTVSKNADIIGTAAIAFQKTLPEILNDMP
ncbi:MAG: ROK family protein [Acetanaerobacterium sp.]